MTGAVLMPAATVRALARPRTAVDRLRTRATCAALAGAGAAVLTAASTAGLWLPEPWAPPAWGLAEYLRQPGLRPGVLLGAVLLVLPCAALAVQALRLGSLAVARQERLVAVAGATPADLRRLRVTRTRRAFVLGGLSALPAHLLVWLLLGRVPAPGWRLVPEPQVWLLAVWALLVGVLWAAGTLLARRPPGGAGRREPPPAAWGWTAGAAAFLVLVGIWLPPGGTGGYGGSDVVQAAVLLVALLLALAAGGVAFARRAAGRRHGVPGRPVRREAAVTLLAAAQAKADPVAAGAAGGVLLLCGAAAGVLGSLAGYVLGGPVTPAPADVVFYVGGAGAAVAVGAGAAVVVLLSLALSVTEHLLTARRAVAATAALGVEARRLVAVQATSLARTAVPAVRTGVLLAGLVYGVAVLFVDGVPDGAARTTAAVAGAVVVVALAAEVVVRLACRVVAASLAGRVRTAASLEGLRTP